MNVQNPIGNQQISVGDNSQDPLAAYKEILLATGDKKNIAFMNLIGTLKKAKENNGTR